jgi:hypothetical protein
MYHLLNFCKLFFADDVSYVFLVILATNLRDFHEPDWATEASEYDFQ